MQIFRHQMTASYLNPLLEIYRAWQSFLCHDNSHRYFVLFPFDIYFPLLCNQCQWQGLWHFWDIRSDLAVSLKMYYNETKSAQVILISTLPAQWHICLVLLSPPWTGQLSRGLLCKYHRVNSLQPCSNLSISKFTVFVQTFLFLHVISFNDL